MTGWQEFIFNVHTWVIIAFSWGSGYLIGTKFEDKIPTWLLKIIAVFFFLLLPWFLIITLGKMVNPIPLR